MRSIDGYLSRIAQEIDSRSLVSHDDATGKDVWVLEIGEERTGLGDNFTAARQAVTALLRAHRTTRDASQE